MVALPLPRAFSLRVPLVREREVQAGCKRNVIPLDGRIRSQRMVVKYIRQGHLPAEPLVELGDQAEVERPAQDAHIIGSSGGKCDVRLTEARVEEKALGEDTVLAEL